MMKKMSQWIVFFGAICCFSAFAQEPPARTEVIASVDVTSSSKTEEFSYDELRRFARAFALIRNQYVEPMSDKALMDAAIEGMMNALDPHSAYLNKEEMIDIQEDTDGEFGGLGIEIGEEKGYVHIISPIEGTPAAKAGILPGDIIIKVDDEAMKDKPLSEVIKRLRGDPGSSVKLTISRPSSSTSLDMTLTRELIQVRSVRSKMVDEIAYFRISQFQTNTVNDLLAEIKKVKTKPKGIVLDLRNDPGGLLNIAVGVVQVFSSATGTVVSTKARSQTVEEYSQYIPEGKSVVKDGFKQLPSWLHDLPMVVLINVGSASASEIVAGALQDFKRATIMGNHSFGKGSVQVVLPLDDETGIKLTTARYYTPSGRSIQAKGITPDIVVSDTEQGNLFRLAREVDLDDHLKNESHEEEIRSMFAVKVDENKNDEKMYEFGSADDFQLKQAINHLKGLPVNQGVLNPTLVSEAPTEDKPKDESLSVPDVSPKPVEKALDKALDKVRDKK